MDFESHDPERNHSISRHESSQHAVDTDPLAKTPLDAYNINHIDNSHSETKHPAANYPSLATPIPHKPSTAPTQLNRHITFEDPSQLHSPKPSIDEKRQMLKSPDSHKSHSGDPQTDLINHSDLNNSDLNHSISLNHSNKDNHSDSFEKPAHKTNSISSAANASYDLQSNDQHKHKPSPPLPSLTIKSDHNLRSCLSPPHDYDHLSRPDSNIASQPAIHHSQQHSSSEDQANKHPSFEVGNDPFSPNKHGLLQVNQQGVVTPSNNEQFAHSHIISEPSSVLSSKPGSPSAPANGDSPKKPSTIASPPSSIRTHSNSSAQPPQPPLVSHTKLSYSSTNVNDKKMIDTMRSSISPPIINHSNNSTNNIISNRTSGANSPATQPLDEALSETTLPTGMGLPSQQSTPNGSEKLHLLIGITGCISIHNNIFLIIEKLFDLYTRDKLEIQVILTKAAEWFLSEKLHKFEHLGVKVWFHDDGVKHYLISKLRDNPKTVFNKLTPSILNQYFLAYELQKWTDVLLLAPLSANTMAKLVNGLGDNLLTDLLHIWPPPTPSNTLSPSPPDNQDKTVLTNTMASSKPIVASLALTSSMYSHPITKRQLAMLQESYPNMSILKPVEKCVDIDGNISMGGMRSWCEVVDFLSKKLGHPVDVDDQDDDNDDEDEVQEGEEEEDEDDDDEDDDENDEIIDAGMDENIKRKNDKISGNSKKTMSDATEEEEEKRQTKELMAEEAEKDTATGHIEVELDDEKSKPTSEHKSIPSTSTKPESINTGGAISAKSPLTKKELDEHTRLASRNALINSGLYRPSPPISTSSMSSNKHLPVEQRTVQTTEPTIEQTVDPSADHLPPNVTIASRNGLTTTKPSA